MAEHEAPNANAAPHNLSEAGENQQEKKKDESPLEEIVNGFKKVAATAAIVAMPFLYGFYDPTHITRAAITTGAFAASKVTTNIIQEKDIYDGIVRNSFNGALLSYPISEGFKGLNSLEAAIEPSYGTAAAKTIKGASMVFGLQPSVTAGNVALNYGLGKKFRENLWPTLKTSFKRIGFLGMLNVNWLYQFGLTVQMGVSGVLSFLLNLSSSSGGENKGSIKNLYSALNPFSYVTAGVSVTSKFVKNVLYNSYSAAHDTGLALSGSYK